MNGPFQNTSTANAILQVPTIPYVQTPLQAPAQLALIGLTQPVPGGSTGAIIQTSQGGSGSIIGGYAATVNPPNFGTFTNVGLHLKNLTFRAYDNPNITALNLANIVTLEADTINIDTGLPPNCGYTGSTPTCTPTTPTHTNAAGIVMPYIDNIGLANVANSRVYGFYNNYIPSEHSYLSNDWSSWGYNCYNWNSAGGHSSSATQIKGEHCTHIITATSRSYISISEIGIEVSGGAYPAGTYDVYDPSNLLNGFMFYEKSGGGALVTDGGIYLGAGTLQGGGFQATLATLGNNGGPSPSVNVFGASAWGFGGGYGGTFYSWNQQTGTYGETDFINNCYTLSPCGFDFYSVPQSGTPLTLAARIDGAGNAHFNSINIPGRASGMVTLSSGAATVTTSAACTPNGTTCNIVLANCGVPSGQTVLGTPIWTSTNVGVSFNIASASATNTEVTGDSSNICWRIN